MYPPPPPQWDATDAQPPATASAPPLHPAVVTSAWSTHQFPHGAAPGPLPHVPSHPPVPWSTGLFDCCDDVGNCCLTCFCPCITFGQVAEIVDGGSTSCGGSGGLYALIMCLTGWACMYSCLYRTKLRGQFFLEEAPCSDCLVHCCCESCALCQEYRELTHRGFNVPMGWKANMERKARAVNLPPALQGGMTR